MIIKNFMINERMQFINQIEKDLIEYNISYVTINEECYSEIHFLDYIYRFFDYKAIRDLGYSAFNEIYDDIATAIINSSNNMIDDLFCNQDFAYKYNKEKTGYKRLNKNNIKLDSLKYKTKTKIFKKRIY